MLIMKLILLFFFSIKRKRERQYVCSTQKHERRLKINMEINAWGKRPKTLLLHYYVIRHNTASQLLQTVAKDLLRERKKRKKEELKWHDQEKRALSIPPKMSFGEIKSKNRWKDDFNRIADTKCMNKKYSLLIFH